MIRSSSIVYALFVITILTILSASFVLYLRFHNQLVIDEISRLKQLSYVESACTLLRSEFRKDEFFSQNKQLFDGDTASKVQLKRLPWGAFEIIYCSSKIRKKGISKIQLVGQNSTFFDGVAIYLVDKKQPLSLSGNTKINGDVFLPEAGVKRAYVEGRSFKGTTLINGEIKKSSEQIPDLNAFLDKSIERTKGRTPNLMKDSIGELELLLQQGRLYQKFSKPTVLYKQKGDIELKNITLSGNIIIQSDSTIRLHRTADLKNVILFGKKIIFETGYKGQLQAFATDTLIVGEKSEFFYPSVLATYGKVNSGTQLIEIKNESVVSGIVFQERAKVASNDLSIIKLNEESVIEGQIYTKGSVNVTGAVAGVVICSNFNLRTSSSIYENYLLDAEIEAEKRSRYYVGVNFFEDNLAEKKVIDELE